jgi:hypothetical protein
MIGKEVKYIVVSAEEKRKYYIEKLGFHPGTD